MSGMDPSPRCLCTQTHQGPSWFSCTQNAKGPAPTSSPFNRNPGGLLVPSSTNISCMAGICQMPGLGRSGLDKLSELPQGLSTSRPRAWLLSPVEHSGLQLPFVARATEATPGPMLSIGTQDVTRIACSAAGPSKSHHLSKPRVSLI